jgi:hypothetical protein
MIFNKLNINISPGLIWGAHKMHVKPTLKLGFHTLTFPRVSYPSSRFPLGAPEKKLVSLTVSGSSKYFITVSLNKVLLENNCIHLKALQKSKVKRLNLKLVNLNATIMFFIRSQL